MRNENLIQNKGLSREEVRAVNSKGGKNSVKKRAKQKSMREMAKLFSELPVDDNAKQKLEKLGIDATEANYQMAMIVTLAQKAIKGDVRAIKAYQELLGQDAQTINKTLDKTFRQAELKLREREIELKEKELEMRMKALSNDIEEDDRVIIVNDLE